MVLNFIVPLLFGQFDLNSDFFGPSPLPRFRLVHVHDLDRFILPSLTTSFCTEGPCLIGKHKKDYEGQNDNLSSLNPEGFSGNLVVSEFFWVEWFQEFPLSRFVPRPSVQDGRIFKFGLGTTHTPQGGRGVPRPKGRES